MPSWRLGGMNTRFTPIQTTEISRQNAITPSPYMPAGERRARIAIAMNTDRNQRRLLEKQNAKLPPYLQRVPPDEWPRLKPPDLVEVWRSRGFLVQIYTEPSGYQRMSICRSVHNGDSWVDQVTWDELMRLKRECGRGGLDAVEVFPADQDIVNVANMRHLFFPPEPLTFKWSAPR